MCSASGMGIDNNNSSSSSYKSRRHNNGTMEEEALEIESEPDCSTNNDIENNNDKPETFF